MNWDEYRKKIDDPIDGQHNIGTQIANIAWLSYETYMNTVALEKQILTLEKDIDTMKSIINDLRSDISELSNIDGEV